MRFGELARRAWQWVTLSGATFDAQIKPIDRVISMALGLESGGIVTRDLALSVPGVLKARNQICGSISTLPLIEVDGERRPVVSAFLEQIDPDVANVVTIGQTVEDLIFYGISWWEKTELDSGGFPLHARRRDPASVTLQPPANGKSPAPLPSGQDPREAVVYVDGRPVPVRRMIRFDSPNPGILNAARRPIRRAIFLDQMSELYARNPRPLDYFSPREDADPADDDAIAEMLADWRQARQDGTTAYIPYALEYNTVDVPSPADLQLLEQTKRATLEIANVAGLDPEDLGVSTTSRTYQNAIDRRQDRINETLAVFMSTIGQRLTMPDVTARGHVVRFDLSEYLRADPATRANVYATLISSGVMDPEEARTAEGWPAGAPGPAVAAPAGAPNNVRPIRPGVAASAHASATFDAAGARHFDLPLRHFAVNVERRTIEGLAVPYGETATKWWRTYEFAPGALQLAGSTPDLWRRNKMLRDHDYAQALGVLVFHEDRPDGVFARYRIAAGPEGDRALALAADGVLDGLSVGVDWDDTKDERPHPTKPGVTLVMRADWRETSLTAMPSFDSARVTRVAASVTKGYNMDPCTTCGHVHASGTPCVQAPAPVSAPPAPVPAPAAVNFGPGPAPGGINFALPTDPVQLAQLLQLLAANPHQQPAPVAGVVDATAHALPGAPAGGVALVREPAAYRFDRRGNLMRGSHDFSTDVFMAVGGSEAHMGASAEDRLAAQRRAVEFVAQQFVITTDVDELSPTVQRPDMYVDQRTFRYPVWEAINKGTLTEITPFMFPKFSSAGTLVANHVEGVEPSLGTFVTTSQTVTPTAVSGKVKLTRETFDQGGNPQVSSLIWRQMLKAYYEALEAFAVLTLDNATPTGITLTTAGGTTGQTLSRELDLAFAALQYVRGGFTMDNLFAQIDLYTALAGARDGSARPLYPKLGPTNANGQVASRSGAIDLGGVIAYPAWALAATGVVAASSYLFDSDSVHGWASAPQRIDIDRTEVANVYIGLWGYKAAAISDINGVREVIYDPA